MIKKVIAISAIAFAIIIILTVEGIITPLLGIILSVLAFLAPIIVTVLITAAITNAFSPKTSLKIKKLQFVKKSFQNIDGYQLKAEVTNKGKKICMNLDATFQIQDSQKKSPKLLQISVTEWNKRLTVDSVKEEPMRDTRYAWNKKGERTYLGNWTELRQEDSVSLLFPYETVGAGDLDSGSFSHSEVLLKLEKNVNYDVIVEVKGEDSEKNTAIKKEKQTLRI